jgi:hypothetical protein
MIFDYRQTPRAKEGYFICLGKQNTYLFEWENFDTAPQNPRGRIADMIEITVRCTANRTMILIEAWKRVESMTIDEVIKLEQVLKSERVIYVADKDRGKTTAFCVEVQAITDYKGQPIAVLHDSVWCNDGPITQQLNLNTLPLSMFFTLRLIV